MGRRLGKRRRKVTLAGTDQQLAHDRRATDLLRNAQVAPLDVDDPFEAGAKITVMRSVRRDPLAWMHACKQIDEAQYQAGRAWQKDWELAEQGPKAIDPTKEPVDGGRLPEAITDSRKQATDRLVKLSATLVADELKILRASLADGLTAEQVGLVHFGRYGRKWAEKFSLRLKEILNKAAVFYGFAMAG